MLDLADLGELFEDIQLGSLFSDSKTFPDCIPLRSLAEIKSAYTNERSLPSFSLERFISEHFRVPPVYSSPFVSDRTTPVGVHIDKLWSLLRREPATEYSSLINLPHPYIVPGGRFRELYYWDSYFTMLGLKVSGQAELVRQMMDNFASLINRFGFVPNGNRSYYRTRSQPPFFSLMVTLLSDLESREVIVRYLPQLEAEYQFWMKDADLLTEENPTTRRVVLFRDGEILNRYWDDAELPRSESYKEDIHVGEKVRHKKRFYRNIRAAAESGWDFSSRWMSEGYELYRTRTTDLVPVDLNCLLVHLEEVLAEGFHLSGEGERSKKFKELAVKRRHAINKYCWSPRKEFYFDYNIKIRRRSIRLTLAATFPLFFKIASPQQAEKVEDFLVEGFLKPGGLTTTLEFSGQQWDAPNGWAPLQWISYQGLLNYEFVGAANEVRQRWLSTVERVFKTTGKMMEKYNVWDISVEGGGGEYPNQDGFGWTNGVYLAMKESEVSK